LDSDKYKGRGVAQNPAESGICAAQRNIKDQWDSQAIQQNEDVIPIFREIREIQDLFACVPVEW